MEYDNDDTPETWQSVGDVLHAIIAKWPPEQREKFYAMYEGV